MTVLLLACRHSDHYRCAVAPVSSGLHLSLGRRKGGGGGGGQKFSWYFLEGAITFKLPRIFIAHRVKTTHVTEIVHNV